MATKQADGTDVTLTSTDNNGGSIKANGTISGTFQATSVTQQKVGAFGSTVVDGDSADKALTAGTFAYDNESPVAKKLTNSLAGVSNDYLISGAADPSRIRSIHRQERVTTRRQTKAIREGEFNIYTGKFNSGFPVNVVDEFFDISTNSLSPTSTDDAASPSREVPGELTYVAGNTSTILVPKNDTYDSKTG